MHDWSFELVACRCTMKRKMIDSTASSIVVKKEIIKLMEKLQYEYSTNILKIDINTLSVKLVKHLNKLKSHHVIPDFKIQMLF